MHTSGRVTNCEANLFAVIHPFPWAPSPALSGTQRHKSYSSSITSDFSSIWAPVSWAQTPRETSWSPRTTRYFSVNFTSNFFFLIINVAVSLLFFMIQRATGCSDNPSNVMINADRLWYFAYVSARGYGASVNKRLTESPLHGDAPGSTETLQTQKRGDVYAASPELSDSIAFELKKVKKYLNMLCYI